MAIGPSKEFKWVGKKGCAMPWCYAVANFEVTTSRFFSHVSGRLSLPLRNICKASGL